MPLPNPRKTSEKENVLFTRDLGVAINFNKFEKLD
jgi:hypothetical protein